MALKYEVLGDVNGDGQINGYDAMLILSHVAGNIQLNTSELRRANVDQNLSVNAIDARKVLQHLAGIEIIDNISIFTE